MKGIPDNNQGVAIIMIGVPGSGKSTFAGQYLPFAKRINLDTLHTRKNERRLLLACIDSYESFVVDNTNPAKTDRAPYIKAAKAAGYLVIGCYMQSSIAACIERNSQRSGKACVPDHVIAHISRLLELPDYEEGFDQLYYVRMKENGFVIEEWRLENEV